MPSTCSSKPFTTTPEQAEALSADFWCEECKLSQEIIKDVSAYHSSTTDIVKEVKSPMSNTYSSKPFTTTPEQAEALSADFWCEECKLSQEIIKDVSAYHSSTTDIVKEVKSPMSNTYSSKPFTATPEQAAALSADFWCEECGLRDHEGCIRIP